MPRLWDRLTTCGAICSAFLSNILDYDRLIVFETLRLIEFVLTSLLPV